MFTNWQMQMPRSEAMVAPSTGPSLPRESTASRAATVDVARDSSAKPSATAPNSANEAEDGSVAPQSQPGAETGAKKPESRAQASPAQTDVERDLSTEERREVERLEARDAEVRRHEQAHVAAAGPHAGTPRYEFETGPDGQRYAVAGRVPISTSDVAGDPEASLRKLEQVVRAALAPAEPSSADRAVASSARSRMARIRSDKLRDATAEASAMLNSDSKPRQLEASDDSRPLGMESKRERLESAAEPLEAANNRLRELQTPSTPGEMAELTSDDSALDWDELGSRDTAMLGSEQGLTQRAVDAYRNLKAEPVTNTINLLQCSNCGGLHSV